MSALPDIRAVTFDAAGTLLFPNPSVGKIYQEIMAAHGLHLDDAELESGFRAAFRETSKGDSEPETRELEYWKAVVANTIRPLASIPENFEAIFDELWTEFAKGSRWRIADDAIETFDYLEGKGIALALLTNWDQRVHSVVRDHGLDARLDHVFVSSEIGADKPDPRIFDFAAQSLNCSPDQILHVGDSLQEDALGALNSGWNAALLDPNACESNPKVHRISTLLDLRDIISSLSFSP